LGQALGVAFGAKIAAAYDWRLAFILLGAAGLLAAAAVWAFVREPARGATDATPKAVQADVDHEVITFGSTIRLFFSRPTLTLVSLAGGATQFVTYATLGFTTLFLMREKGMTLDQVAIWYALVIGIGISAGIFLSGRLIDRFGGRYPQAYGFIPAISLALAIPFFIGFVHAPTWPVAMLFLIGPTFFNYFYLTPGVTLVQNSVPARQRTVSGAVLLLITNLIGLGLGPTWVGAVSDWFRGSNPANSLQLAFYSLVPFYLIAIALYLALARAIQKEHHGQKSERS
jgi:predicted MFS family arabinose efflux permease